MPVAFDFTAWYAWIAYAGALYLFWSAVAEKGHQHLRWLAGRFKRADPGSTREVDAIAVLRSHRTEHTQAKIIVFPSSQVPLARRLGDLFERADWIVNLNQTPQEAHNPTYVEGVTVAGHNGILVDAVTGAVRTLGATDVRPVVEKTAISQGNPKYDSAIATVRVTIGHPRSVPAEDRA